jgi:hypothetical protein
MADPIFVPDTTLCGEAAALVSEILPPPILRHTMRTYRLGAAYGQKRGIDFEAEDLYLAALFHDIGLAPGRTEPRVPFQVVGGRALTGFLDERRFDPGRAARLREAIDYHMQVRPRWSKGPVAGLLQVGAWMDATRLRAWAVPGAVREADRLFPRAGFTTAFVRCLAGTVGDLPSLVGLWFPDRYR